MLFQALSSRTSSAFKATLHCTAALSCLLLGGCWQSVPDFSSLKGDVLKMVKLDQPEDTRGFINQTTSDQTQMPHSMARWWETIDDPLLQRYVDKLLKQNLDITQATQRIMQARTELTTARSDFLPSLTTTQNAGRSFAPNATTDQRQYANSFGADLDISWQLDLFGKIRKSTEAAQARFDATIYEREALAQSLVAALLERRVAIAVQAHMLTLSEQIAVNAKNTLDIVKRRYEAGANGVTLAEVYSAQNAYDMAMANTHDYDIALHENIYALDVLLGDQPGTNQPLIEAFPLASTPPSAPACLPASLLDRRPDLKSSELALKAASADISVAVADLYPDLTLGGSLGVTSDSTGNLLTADRLAGSLLGTLTTRLFEGGALRANIQMREAQAREQAALYAQNILGAIEEVENAMKSERELSNKLLSAQHAFDTLTKAEDVAQKRYERGTITAQDLLEARNNTLNAGITLHQTQQNLWSARTALYLALGGNWFGGHNACKMANNGQDTEK